METSCPEAEKIETGQERLAGFALILILLCLPVPF